MEEGNTLFSKSTLSYTRTPIIKIKINQHENRTKHENEIQTYDSERNVLTNDNKFIRTFPACLSPDQKHNKGFSGTPELFKTNQLEYFKKVLDQYQKGQVKEQISQPKSKTSRVYNSSKKRDHFLNPKQQDKSQNKSQEQDEAKAQKSELINQKQPNQRDYQEQKQPQTLRYQDYKQLHHEQRKLYLYKRSQPLAFTQRSQLSEINTSSKTSFKDIEFQYFKPKNVRISQKSAIRLYAPDKEKKSKFHICPDNLQVQKTNNENNQNYIYKQHLIRSLNPKYPPILATEATNSSKLNNILCNVQQTNLKTLQENILKTIKNTPKNKLTLGDRILLLTLLEEKQYEYLNDKGQIFSI